MLEPVQQVHRGLSMEGLGNLDLFSKLLVSSLACSALQGHVKETALRPRNLLIGPAPQTKAQLPLLPEDVRNWQGWLLLLQAPRHRFWTREGISQLQACVP